MNLETCDVPNSTWWLFYFLVNIFVSWLIVPSQHPRDGVRTGRGSVGVTLPTTASTDVTSAQRQKAGRDPDCRDALWQVGVYVHPGSLRI